MHKVQFFRKNSSSDPGSGFQELGIRTWFLSEVWIQFWNWNFGTGYKTGPCFETRTGTKLGPEPELAFLANNAFGAKKVALNQLETFSLNYDIKDIFNQLHYRNVLTFDYINLYLFISHVELIS
jgi:hypothetical protein